MKIVAAGIVVGIALAAQVSAQPSKPPVKAGASASQPIPATPKVAPQPAQQSAPAQVLDKAAVADVLTLKATVNSVDTVKRVVSLTGPLGRIVYVRVDEKVPNLAEVKAGDTVVLKYAEAVSIDVRKGSAPEREKVAAKTDTGTDTGTKTQAKTKTKANAKTKTVAEGEKPAVAQLRQKRWTATIEKLDAPRQVALVHGPAGRYAEIKVKDPALFKTLAVNDQLDVTYTEAMIVEVAPPSSAKAAKAEKVEKKK